ncbi:MAG: hypothetical protein KF866_03485 [Phycisphaeraceae bacterium]|nr:hypothetical protein [Phycisphaeraceae bacterium]MCW5753245.1 hypothetical protein [Phycisphaeraceae bacterium]
MPLWNRLVAATAGIVLVAPMAAAEPGVPAKFVTGDTMMVARINLSHIKTQVIKDTLTALVDADALKRAGIDNPLDTPDIRQMIAGLGMVEGFATTFVGMGATSVSIVVEAPQDPWDSPNVQILMPAASADASDQIIGMMNMMGGMGSMAQKHSEGGQHWLVFAPMGGGSGKPSDASAVSHFNSALSGMEGASISFAMLPVSQLREQMLEDADDEEQARIMKEMLDATRWMGMSISLGKQPTVRMVGEMKNASAAEKVNGHWKELLGTLTSKAKEVEADEGDDWPAGAPKPTEVAGFLVKAAAMETSGSRVSVVFDSRELRELTTMIIRIADATGFDPMDFMPGMGGF